MTIFIYIYRNTSSGHMWINLFELYYKIQVSSIVVLLLIDWVGDVAEHGSFNWLVGYWANRHVLININSWLDCVASIIMAGGLNSMSFFRIQFVPEVTNAEAQRNCISRIPGCLGSFYSIISIRCYDYTCRQQHPKNNILLVQLRKINTRWG